MMDKKQFMRVLQANLYPLGESERAELLRDYEEHFVIGLQEGKSEEDIVRELGHPMDLAKEALGDRFVEPQVPQHIESSRSVFAFVALVFLNLMIMIPIGISIWAVWISLASAAAMMSLSLFIILLDTLLNPGFYPAKWFAGIGTTGVGILLGIAVYYVFNPLYRATVAYVKWNFKTVKGRG